MSVPGDTARDPLPEALALAQGAADAGVGLKLLGGLAVRVLVPGLPAHTRPDIEFGCLSGGSRDVAAYLERCGCVPDRRFNNLNGDRQLYFTAPSGRPLDVLADRITRYHELDFRSGFGRLPLTLDAIDILLAGLQIVEPGAEDTRDILHLLAGLPVRPATGGVAGDGDGEAAEIVLDTCRFGDLLGADWGRWRTVTGNLARLPALVARNPDLAPRDRPHDPLAQASVLTAVAEQVPKSVRWKLRANVGERLRWYEVPDDVGRS